jgi:hypothetical protein
MPSEKLLWIPMTDGKGGFYSLPSRRLGGADFSSLAEAFSNRYYFCNTY